MTAYVPPHLRKATRKEVRQEFRQEFPQLATPVVVPAMNFSHIAHLVEPLPPKVVVPLFPHGWVNLKDPSTYIHPQPSLDTLMHRMIGRMVATWEEWDRAHDIVVKYECDDDEFDDYESDSDSSSMTAEDAEYFSDE
jgi:hypothetical protein